MVFARTQPVGNTPDARAARQLPPIDRKLAGRRHAEALISYKRPRRFVTGLVELRCTTSIERSGCRATRRAQSWRDGAIPGVIRIRLPARN